jgi:hypothetical protein
MLHFHHTTWKQIKKKVKKKFDTTNPSVTKTLFEHTSSTFSSYCYCSFFVVMFTDSRASAYVRKRARIGRSVVNTWHNNERIRHTTCLSPVKLRHTPRRVSLHIMRYSRNGSCVAPAIGACGHPVTKHRGSQPCLDMHAITIRGVYAPACIIKVGNYLLNTATKANVVSLCISGHIVLCHVALPPVFHEPVQQYASRCICPNLKVVYDEFRRRGVELSFTMYTNGSSCGIESL